MSSVRYEEQGGSSDCEEAQKGILVAADILLLHLDGVI